MTSSVAGDMGFRDRFYTPQTAKAILSWRIAVGIAVAVATAVAGMPVVAAIAVGTGVYAALIAAAIPRPPRRQPIDAFTLGEPWRQLIQGSQAARRKLADTVAGVEAGPLRQQLDAIVAQLDHGLDEAWRIAKRGDEIDDTVRKLDPTALRSKLATLQQRASATPSAEANAAVEAVQQQLDTADRLKRQSEETAGTLRMTQAQLDALVAGASEVKVGTADTNTYAREVDDLVLRLEALRQAVEETGAR